jgi:hypothetical protein
VSTSSVPSYFLNVHISDDGIGNCRVCTSPISSEYTHCHSCKGHLAGKFREELADSVRPLMWVERKPNSQSMNDMYQYKGADVDGRAKSALGLKTLLAHSFTTFKACIIGEGDYTSLCHVPSSKWCAPNTGLPVIRKGALSRVSGNRHQYWRRTLLRRTGC